ncbi:hypothetical protein JCM1840_004130 [Sporobolomyces johnsonii]
MPALVSSLPQPVPLDSFASTASSSPRYPDHPRPPDDLLAETLVYDENGVAHTRDYTDDLEDLVSMSVAQQLHSRRSQSTMHTYLPQSPPPPPLHPRSSNGSLRSNYLSSSPSQSHSLFPRSPSEDALGRPVPRSGIPRPGPGGGSKSRSPSPEVPRSPSGNIGSKIPGPVQMARGKSAGGPASEGAGAGGEEWETLQVGTGSQVRSHSQPPNRKGSAANGHGPKPVNFPSSATPSNRPLATKSSNTQTPRKRAQTQQNLGAATAAGRSGPSSHRAGAASTPPNGTSSTSRRPAANRTHTTTTPSSSARGKPRRKSISTSRELSNASPSPSYDPDASSSSLPHWSTTRAPLVFRTSKGELGTSGRPEDLVLPAVARRLEAERLAKLGLQQKENDPWLFDEWGVDGTPRSMTVGGLGREGRDGSGTPTPSRGGRGQDEEEGRGASTRHEQLDLPSETVDHQTRRSSRGPEPDGPSSPSPHSLSVGAPSPRPNSHHDKPAAISLNDGPAQPVGEMQAIGEKSEKAAAGGKGGHKDKRQKSDADKAGCCACVIS